MKIITVDLETYYDRKYSLSKMTTEEYIRDPQFEVIGVAVQVDGEDPVWFSGTKERTKEFLDKWELHKHIVIAHNAMFDMAILNWHFDIRPKRIVDTLSMARALHSIEVGGSLAALAEYYQLGEKGTEVINALGKRRLDFTAEELAAYGEYCKNDVVLTYNLFQKLATPAGKLVAPERAVESFPVSELRLIDLTIRMFTEPKLELNEPTLQTHMNFITNKKMVFLLNYNKEGLMSNPKFAASLRALGVDPPMKISPTTGKETYAFSKTDEEFKALLEHENLEVQELVAARLGVKSTLEETRTQRFLDIAKRGTLPIPLRYYAAHTGRWGGDDKVNMQNLPRKSLLKHAIRAPKGFKLCDSDSSQIEARTLAWLAGQDDLVEAFEKDEDVYIKMASKIYGKPESEITKEERFVGKTVVLGCGYGLGAAKLQLALKNGQIPTDVTLDEAQAIIDTYRETYPKITALWKQAGRALEAMMRDNSAPLGVEGVLSVEGAKGIRLPNGLYLKYPNLRRVTNAEGKDELVYDTKRGKQTVPTRVYGGKLIENVCQALARIIIGEQMLLINRRYPVVMTVHDAIACLIPEHEEKTGTEVVEMCMKVRPSWAQGLPLNCEAGSGDSYGEC